MIKYGLKIPIELDSKGHLMVVRGGDQLEKLIMLAVSDHTNTNPYISQFPNLGLVGQVDNQEIRNQIQDSINSLFQELEAEERARLVDISFRKGEDGTLFVDVTYQDMEESERTVTVHLGGHLGGENGK